MHLQLDEPRHLADERGDVLGPYENEGLAFGFSRPVLHDDHSAARVHPDTSQRLLTNGENLVIVAPIPFLLFRRARAVDRISRLSNLQAFGSARALLRRLPQGDQVDRSRGSFACIAEAVAHRRAPTVRTSLP